MHVSLTSESVTDNPTFDIRNDGLDMGFVQTENGRSVKRYFIDEMDERSPQVIQTGVALHVIFINVGDDG
jgi:hypothetical protein